MDVEVDAEAKLEIKTGEEVGIKNGETPMRLWSRPAQIPGSYVAANPAATYSFLNFPPPTPGKVWEVVRVAVQQGAPAVDPFTALVGVTAHAYITSQTQQDSSSWPAGFSDLLGVLGTIPNTMYPGRDNAFCRGQSEHVVIAMKGLAAGQIIVASMQIIEHDLKVFLKSLSDVD